MNSTFLAGLIIAAIVIVGGIALITYQTPDSQTASTTTVVLDSLGSGTESTTPSAPSVTTSSMADVTSATAVVTGKVNPNGAPTSYWYEYGTTSTLGARTSTQTIGGGAMAIPAPAIIKNLSAKTMYYYRLSAKNANGTVDGQMFAFTTNSAAAIQAAAPPITHTNAALNIASTSVTLGGQITPNGSDTSYWFEYGTTTSFGATVTLQSAGTGTTSKSVTTTLSGLSPLTTYYFRLNAQNQYGTTNGATLSFITK